MYFDMNRPTESVIVLLVEAGGTLLIEYDTLREASRWDFVTWTSMTR